MDLQLDKDNVPAYLVAWDDLSLHIDLDPKVQEICFSRQIERSTQLKKVFEDHQIDCVRNKDKYRTYKCLRKRVDTHMGIALVMANRKKQQNQAAGAMGLVASGKGTHQGVCGSWKRNGACPKIDDCPNLHPDDQKQK